MDCGDCYAWALPHILQEVVMSLRSFVLSAAALCFAFGSATAKADTINYTLTGYNALLTFSLDSHAQGGQLVSNGSVYFLNVPATLNGVASPIVQLVFSPAGGTASPLTIKMSSLGIFDESFTNVFFTTNAGIVTLDTGTFEVGSYTLTAVGPATAVAPEPSSILLLATGTIGLGFYFRRGSFLSTNAAA
jgi:hypothetical protein